jgi:hypothetical protein
MTRFLLCASGVLAAVIGVAVAATSDGAATFFALVAVVCGAMLFCTGMIVGAIESLRPTSVPVPQQQWSQQHH